MSALPREQWLALPEGYEYHVAPTGAIMIKRPSTGEVVAYADGEINSATMLDLPGCGLMPCGGAGPLPARVYFCLLHAAGQL